MAIRHLARHCGIFVLQRIRVGGVFWRDDGYPDVVVLGASCICCDGKSAYVFFAGFGHGEFYSSVRCYPATGYPSILHDTLRNNVNLVGKVAVVSTEAEDAGAFVGEVI